MNTFTNKNKYYVLAFQQHYLISYYQVQSQ